MQKDLLLTEYIARLLLMIFAVCPVTSFIKKKPGTEGDFLLSLIAESFSLFSIFIVLVLQYISDHSAPDGFARIAFVVISLSLIIADIVLITLYKKIMQIIGENNFLTLEKRKIRDRQRVLRRAVKSTGGDVTFLYNTDEGEFEAKVIIPMKT